MPNRRVGYTLSKAAVTGVARQLLALPRVRKAIDFAIKQDEALTDILVEQATALADQSEAVDPAISDVEFEYFIDSVLELVWKKIGRAIANDRM